MSDDPVRLDLAEDVPALAAEALRFARRDAPDAARLAAIEAAVLVKIAPPPGGGGDGGGGAGGAGGSSLSPMAKAGAAAAAAGAAVVVIVLATRSAPPPPVAHETASTATMATASATASATQGAQSAESPTLSVNDLPSADDASSASKRVTGPNASAPLAPDPAESERAEVALLDRAQASLAARPADTLASCDDHARRFPSGTLVQEREVLAIDALVRLSRRDEAEARAARFRKSFPRSGHLRRVDALLGR